MTDDRKAVRIRPMGTQDIGRVMAIADSLEQAPHWPRDVYERALDPAAAPARIALVAEDSNGGIVGFALTSLIPPQAELETIGVVAEAQGQRIGRLLLDVSLVELKKNQISEVMLEVRESNRAARAFYRALGFVETGRRSSYYADPQEDALLLRRSVS